MTSPSPRFAAAAALAAALLLAGCAGPYTLDNTVRSFSQIASLPAPATYRFERLPSQHGPQHAQLEALADAALNAAGLRRDDASPRYAVQVNARAERMVSPFAVAHFADPWDRYGWGFGHAWGWHRHWGFGLGHRLPMEPSWYHREVDVIVRDLRNDNRVVYESRAVNEGPYVDAAKVLPAMFTAAMQGFPNPPPGPRQVAVQVAG